MSEIDYAHDSLAEITLKQREIIEQQGYRMLFLASENLALKADADSVISQELNRLMEALLLVEGWVFHRLRTGEEWMNARAMYRVLTECFDYAENEVMPPWFAAARKAHTANMEEEE